MKRFAVSLAVAGALVSSFALSFSVKSASASDLGGVFNVPATNGSLSNQKALDHVQLVADENDGAGAVTDNQNDQAVNQDNATNSSDSDQDQDSDEDQ